MMLKIILEILEFGFLIGILDLSVVELKDYVEFNLLFNFNWIKFLNKLKFCEVIRWKPSLK